MLGRGHVVVVDEDHLDARVDLLVIVDEVGDGIDEFDDGLGPHVPGSGFGTEDEDALGGLQVRVLLESEVEVEDVQGVEQLAFVLVQPLDLDVEDGLGINLHALAPRHPGGEAHLVGSFDLGQTLVDALGNRVGVQGEHGEVAHPLVGAGDVVEKIGQPRVALLEPAAWGDTVGLVVELPRPQLVPGFEGVGLDDLGVQGGHTVDRVRRVAGDPRHAHSLVGHRGHVVGRLGVDATAGHVLAEPAIDLTHDLGDAREELLEDRHLPGLQGLGEHRVVGVGEGPGDDGPGGIPAQAVLVHEQPHELGDGQHRVGVVELDGVEVGETVEVGPVVLDVVVDELLQGGRAEEVLLPHSQHLALVGGVVGVEHPGDVHGAFPIDDGVGEALGVEGVIVELVDRLGLPQPQGVDVGGAVTGHRHVVGHGEDVEVGVVDDPPGLLTANDEWVLVLHPGVWLLDLEAVGENLTEQPVAVEDAVTIDGKVEGGARVEETGGQTSQAPIAQGGIGLLLQHVGEVESVGGQGSSCVVLDTQVGEVVEQGSSHEELGGQVVLHASGLVGGRGVVPVVGHPVDDAS